MKNRILLKIVPLSILLVFMAFSPLRATTYTFLTAGNWLNPANWTDGTSAVVPPNPLPIGDNIVIAANCTYGGIYSIVLNGNITVNANVTLTISNSVEDLILKINNIGSNYGTIDVVAEGLETGSTGSFTNFTGAVVQGNSGFINNNGQFINQSGASVNITSCGNTGNFTNNGTIGIGFLWRNIAGSMLTNYGTIANSNSIGGFENLTGATVNMSGGTITFSCGITNTGTINISGGELQLYRNPVTFPTGLTWTGGTITLGASFSIGSGETVTVPSGATLRRVNGNSISINNGGSLRVNGTFTPQSGNFTVQSGGSFSVSSGGSTTFFNTTTFNNSGSATVESGATTCAIPTLNNVGSFTIQNGATLLSTSIITNTGTLTNNGTLTGVFNGGFINNLAGATVTSSGTLNYMSFTNNGIFTNTGTYNMNQTSGALTLNTTANFPSGINWTTGTIFIGASGAATLNSNLTIPLNGTFQVNTGGSLTISNGVTLTNNNSLIINGTVNNNGIIQNGFSFRLNATGTLNNAGSLNQNALSSTLEMKFYGTVSNSGTLNNYGYAQNYAGGNFTNTSTGMLNNTAYFINAGTLTNDQNGRIINGNFTFNNTNVFNNNGILKGSGSYGVNSPITFGANSVISPGASPGQMSFLGSNPAMGTAQYLCEINGTTLGTAYDNIYVIQNFNITNASLTVDWGSFVPTGGNSFSIITHDAGSTLTGPFANVTIPPISGLTFNLSYSNSGVVLSVVDNTPTIQSAQTGQWSDASTWVGRNVPMANNNVIILSTHTVTHGGPSAATASCKNLTINSGGVLNQANLLNIGGNLTILANGVFNNNPTNQYNPSVTTNMATLNGSLPAAGQQLVTNNGTLRLGYNNTTFNLSGRMIFNTGSTFTVEGPLNLGGWSGSTPQYLLDIDNLTTLNGGGFNAAISIPPNAAGNTQRAISTGRGLNFSCNSTYSLLRVGGNSASYFGSANVTTQALSSVYTTNSTPAHNLYLENTVADRMTLGNTNVFSTNSYFREMFLSGTTLNGTYYIQNPCVGTAPNWYITGLINTNNATNLIFSAYDSAVINILPSLAAQPILGTLTAQNSNVVVKGNTLDLRSATLTGFDSEHFFLTKMGQFAYNGLGKIQIATSGGGTTNIHMGISLPNADVYTPLSIVDVAGTNVTVSAQTFTTPAGYYAPNVQWNIQSNATSPSMSITFKWQTAIESAEFATNRMNAKVYRLNGSTWEELICLPLNQSQDGYFISAAGITQSGTFAVMYKTPNITSDRSGEWNETSTWVGGIVPTTNDDVTIAHNVSNNNNLANCKNLTINANSNLYQNDRLIISGDLMVNGTFYHNFNTSTTATLSTQIGASSNADPAGTRLVTVNGTLSLGNNLLGGGFYLAGRMVFSMGSTFVLGNYSNLTLNGWSGTTPQYLMDLSNLTTLNLATLYSTINVPHFNGTQPIIPLNRNFLSSSNTCATYPYLDEGDLGTYFNLGNNNSFQFVGSSRQSIQGMSLETNALVNLEKKTFRSFAAIHNNTVISSESEFSRLIAGNGTILHGDYTIIDDCGITPPYFSTVVNTYNNPDDFLYIEPDVNFKVNVTDLAIISIRAATTLNMAGTFTAQSGKMMLKGGTFNLSNATVSGLGSTRFFMTELGSGNYFGRGKLQLPISSVAKKFDVGIK